MRLYKNNKRVIAGITLKNENEKEANNMALHVCYSERTVIENREKLARTLQMSLEDFVCAEQTHSANIYHVTRNDRGRGAYDVTSAIPNTDALYTTEENIVLCAFTADCAPVYFHHEKVGVVGVVHSGWRGTVQQITAKTLQQVMEQYECDSTAFHVYIGMALSKYRFEVDEDVYEQFYALGYAEPYMEYLQETNKYYIDNQLVIQKQCEMLGVPSEQIMIDRTCTYDNENGFSFRQDNETGRHLAFIMKKSIDEQ